MDDNRRALISVKPTDGGTLEILVDITCTDAGHCDDVSAEIIALLEEADAQVVSVRAKRRGRIQARTSRTVDPTVRGKVNARQTAKQKVQVQLS